ncbi:hypothetical protein [Kitasatospora sp. A2-31]|uniref:hypothetical protein n=1 Tax=Kitasatospora sp. A2-31 TaxID=2916414 RepID=UPI001EE96B45|nr:hypothetical protein [Kitasatospora sp. A2-31]MCG6493136.1 hypothetical protein [Kitasatospora sp. A2-31]
MRMGDGRYAPAGTLIGLVQRGRGLGARMAAEDPAAAAELVYGCIRRDWRWGEADQRAVYLARLVRDLRLPLEPVVDGLGRGTETREQAARVLGLLAASGSAQARQALGGRRPEGADGAAHRAPVECGPARDVPAQDVPALVAELERAWVEREWCGADGVARELAGFGAGARGAVSLLRRFWLWTPHSCERASYLEALAAIDPAGLAEIHVECLWGCEEDERSLAVAQAPDRPEVRERLAYLRDDPMEAPAVRAAAGERLAALERP